MRAVQQDQALDLDVARSRIVANPAPSPVAVMHFSVRCLPPVRVSRRAFARRGEELRAARSDEWQPDLRGTAGPIARTRQPRPQPWPGSNRPYARKRERAEEWKEIRRWFEAG